MKKESFKVNWDLIIVGFLMFLLISCGNNKPAPLDSELFGNIAESMQRVIKTKGYSIPINSEQAKVTLEEAFKKNGYSYSATLHKVATDGFSMLEMQMVGVLLLPGNDVYPDLKKIYSGQELKDVEKIYKMMSED